MAAGNPGIALAELGNAAPDACLGVCEGSEILTASQIRTALKVKFPALSLQRTERQGRGHLVDYFEVKGCAPKNAQEIGHSALD